MPRCFSVMLKTRSTISLRLCNRGGAAFAWSVVHGYATLVAGNDPKRPKSNERIVADLLDRVWVGIVKGKDGNNR